MPNKHVIAHDKPQKPKPDECCGGGSCCPCVWDEYREKYRQWQAQSTLKKPTKETN
ncbi:oxidoreductase-like domain-containing protein [uncultured Pseudoalteromonas sp.]|uniref:oxidoreductase-like domain-containing protein n=1 Tax=uncultured Pseudoalteromonas sp. TaxID=114053 RepID=UPI0030C8CF32